jgi:hypothetical protein
MPPPDLLLDNSKILSTPHLSAVEHRILGAALRFALLGRLDASRNFINLLYSRPLTQNLEFSGLRGLVGFWQLSSFPHALPQEFKTDAYFEHIKASFALNWPHPLADEKRTEDELGIAAALHLSQGPRPHPHYALLGRKVALEIAIKLAEEHAINPVDHAKVQEILSLIATTLPANWRDDHLTSSPRCWNLFASGALARKFDLTDEQLDAHAAQILDTLRQRYWHGPTRALNSIPLLLQKCNDMTMLKSDQIYQEMDQEKPTTLFNNPAATTTDMTTLETRLKLSLPTDFKTFLLTTNGFSGIWNGYFLNPPLLPSDKIDWIDVSNYDIRYDQLKLPHNISTYTDPVTREPRDPYETLPTITRVIQLANRDVDVVWLIPPRLMQETRAHYTKMYAAVDEQAKKVIERAIEDFAGSWGQWERLQWGVVCGDFEQFECFGGFGKWLENEAWVAEDVDGGDGEW